MSALAGRRVVVTRAADQADALTALLEAAGAVPVVVPLVTIATDERDQVRLAALDPATFEWLVVTSPNGARHYLDAHAGAPPHVAAVGAATAAALVAGGVDVALVPAEQRAAGLLAEIPAGDGRVLLVQAATAGVTLSAGLTELGWQVTVVAPYRTVPARPSAGEHLAALSADAVLFTSGSAAIAWAAVFGSTTPPIVVAIGPQTAVATAHAGLKVDVVATDHSLRGVVAALERHLAGSD